jgi:hypothetical protein
MLDLVSIAYGRHAQRIPCADNTSLIAYRSVAIERDRSHGSRRRWLLIRRGHVSGKDNATAGTHGQK